MIRASLVRAVSGALLCLALAAFVVYWGLQLAYGVGAGFFSIRPEALSFVLAFVILVLTLWLTKKLIKLGAKGIDEWRMR